MKSLRLVPLFLALAPAYAQTVPLNPAGMPATPATPAADTAKLLPNQQAFLNLPEERRKEFFKNLGEANRLFQQKRIFETLNVLNKADAIFADSPETINIRGACYVEIRAFDKAMAAFEKALQLSPDNASVKFNIGEVYFVTKEWQKACDMLERVLKEIPKEQTSLTRLVEFKILLCKKRLGVKDFVTVQKGKGDEDDKIIAGGKEYTIDDDSPFFCYAQAGIAYDDKNLILAEEWLARAARIFQNPEVIAPWQDTLVEFGYIKSFYGDDLETTGE